VLGLIATGHRALNQAGIFQVRLTLTPEQAAMIATLEGEALYDWIQHEFDEVTAWEMDFKAVTNALVGDFCDYIAEALHASEEGRLAVTYTLLRKPLQDNLFYLEWLLADPGDFLQRFRHGGHRDLITGDLTTTRRKEIIREALRQTGADYLDPEFIDDLRFNKTVHYSLAGRSDKAIHLVTSSQAIRTEQRNFNFIFSGNKDRETQWQHVYITLPYLLYYASQVVDSLFALMASVDAEYSASMQLRRDVGFWLSAASPSRGKDLRFAKARSVAEDLMECAGVACPGCGQPYPLHRRNLRRFALRGSLYCGTCHAVGNLAPGV
jgi:hypothetical protein